MEEEKVFELIEKLYIEMQKGLSNVYAEMQNGFKQVNEKLDQKADKTDIARIEVEHGEKLQALFDGYQAINETLADHTDRLQRIEEKLDAHDIQIHVLDKTKASIK